MEFSKWLIKTEVSGTTPGKDFQNDRRFTSRGARSKYVANDDPEQTEDKQKIDPDKLFGMMKKKMRKGTK